MPTYTYRCPQGHEWDEFRSITTGTDVAESSCPVCPVTEGVGAPGFKVVPSSVSIAFKGKGWTPKFYPNRGT